MAHARDTLETEILAATTRLHQASTREGMAHWLHLDLTAAQIKTLVVLADDAPMTIGQVADMLGVTLPTASHLVDKLVRADFAERSDDPLDRRRAVVRPSARGTDLLRGLREYNESYLRACFARMDDGGIAALMRGMSALADAAETLKRDADASVERTMTREPAPI